MRVPTMLLLAAALLFASTAPAGQTLAVGYLELADDTRYDKGRFESRIPGQPWGRPYVGAQVAAGEVRFPLSTADVTLELRRRTLASRDELPAALDRFSEQGVDLVMLDLPGPAVSQAADAAGDGQVLFNVSATANRLRGKACHPLLFHLAASDAIRMDALAQYMVDRRWRRILVLAGPGEADKRRTAAFRRAADRYGLEIVATREYTRGSDPRQRARNNLDLLTRGDGFDAIFVADSIGEFARTVPYRTRAPRPVVGSAGLVPVWWHWNWRNHGARQLNNRFQEHAGRPMTNYDWSAWIGIKAIAESVMRGSATDAQAIADYLRGGEIVLDGFQGYRLSFRPWNNQLRSAIFLSAPTWVVARAPFEGFLHPDNDLDSLGLAQGESRCDF